MYVFHFKLLIKRISNEKKSISLLNNGTHGITAKLMHDVVDIYILLLLPMDYDVRVVR